MSKAPYAVNGNPQTTAGNAKASPAYCTGIGQDDGSMQRHHQWPQPDLWSLPSAEESFIDANGNGVFDAGDTVAFNASNPDNNYTSGPNSGKPKPWQDTSEPFMNEWELYDAYGTPTYFAGEPFIDFNNNGTRDGPDGAFNGPLCEGPLCSTDTSVAIGVNNIVILSGQQRESVRAISHKRSAVQLQHRPPVALG